MTAATGPIERYDATQYFALAECGVLSPDDRCELLEGLIVSMAPQAPLHAAALRHMHELLLNRLRPHRVIRAQFPFLAGPYNVPEPDIAIVPGPAADYRYRHPARALLIIEVADSSLPQDRLTKSRIYARAQVPTYWVVNLRDQSVECFTQPDPGGARYAATARVRGRDPVPAEQLRELVVTAEELLLPD